MSDRANVPFRAALTALVFVALSAPLARASAEFTPCKNHFAPSQQIQLGDKAEAQIYKQMPVLPDSSPVTQYIAQLGQRLVAAAPGYHWPYKFHVADVAEINAFALPGGAVFVNLGTIQAADTEAQLAGVMAHEISHVVLQHSVCNAEKAQKVGLLAGLGQIAAGVLLGGAAGDLAQEGIGLTAGLGFLKMSRGAEQQADLEGVGIEYDAGFDPHGLPQFFETIRDRYGAGGAQFMSDHPNPGNRTQYVDREIASYPPNPHLITTRPEFEHIKELVARMHAYSAKEVSSGIWKTQSPNQMVASGVNEPAGHAVGSYAPDLDTSGAWKIFGGAGYSLQIPGDWRAYGSDRSALIGPPGGVTRSTEGGAASVVYGMMTDAYQPPRGLRGAGAVDALISDLAGDNPGFRAGDQKLIKASGADGRSVECDNPDAHGGQGERDWVVAFQRPDGTLRYFVFVAPARDFERFRPAFQRILGTIRF